MKYLILALSIFMISCQQETGILNIDSLEDFNTDEREIESTIDIIDTLAAKRLGALLFHKRTNIQQVSCADCHTIDKGGFSLESDPFGNGKFDAIYLSTVPKYFDIDFEIPLDVQPKKTPQIANGGFKDIVLGHGVITKLPFEAQADSASHAHFMQGLDLEATKDMLLQELSYKAYGKRDIDQELINCALSAFEQTIVTSESNVNKVRRGEAKQEFRTRGMELYRTHCYSCHNNDTMSKALGEKPILPIVNTPRIENFFNNVRDGNKYLVFLNKEFHTPYQTIKKHGLELEKNEVYDVINFMKYGLFDPDMDRYIKEYMN